MEMLQQSGGPSARFMADAMLGRLARWLRILGYDTAYEKIITDEALIERVLGEDRWLLTRDRYLAQRTVLRDRHSLIVHDYLDGQLRQLHRDLHIDLDMTHHRGYRCAGCNVSLIFISRDDARPLVPPFVAHTYHSFLQCPHCRRVFWAGTHWDNLLKRLAMINEAKPGCSQMSEKEPP